MITVNEYFQGNLKSLGCESHAGRFTTGIVLPGTYEIPTTQEERLTITVGRLSIKLPGGDWQVFHEGQTVTIAAASRFTLSTEEVCSYLCWYS